MKNAKKLNWNVPTLVKKKQKKTLPAAESLRIASSLIFKTNPEMQRSPSS